MRMTGKTGRSHGRLSRCATLVSAVLLAAAGLAVTAGPAAAAVTYEQTAITLANASAYGMAAQQGVVANSVVVADSPPGNWLADDMHATWTGGSPAVTGEDFEFQAITQKGVISQWCLGDNGAFPELLACGADGTVWVVVHSGNGYYLYSRYYLSQKDNYAIAAYMPVPGPGITLLADVPTLTSGDGFYARWNFSFN
jgi:hypothetical protein